MGRGASRASAPRSTAQHRHGRLLRLSQQVRLCTSIGLQQQPSAGLSQPFDGQEVSSRCNVYSDQAQELPTRGLCKQSRDEAGSRAVCCCGSGAYHSSCLQLPGAISLVCCRDQPSAGPLCTMPACLQTSQLPAFQCRLFAPAVGARCLEQAGWRSRVVADECLCMPKVRDGCLTCQGRRGTGTEAAMVWACFRALLWHLTERCMHHSKQTNNSFSMHSPIASYSARPSLQGVGSRIAGQADVYCFLAVTLRHMPCIGASHWSLPETHTQLSLTCQTARPWLDCGPGCTRCGWSQRQMGCSTDANSSQLHLATDASSHSPPQLACAAKTPEGLPQETMHGLSAYTLGRLGVWEQVKQDLWQPCSAQPSAAQHSKGQHSTARLQSCLPLPCT